MKSDPVSIFSPSVCQEVMGSLTKIPVVLRLSFKPEKFVNSSSLFAIRRRGGGHGAFPRAMEKGENKAGTSLVHFHVATRWRRHGTLTFAILRFFSVPNLPQLGLHSCLFYLRDPMIVFCRKSQ